MQFKQSQLAILAFYAIAKAHFVLQTPFSLGFDDEQESVAPCGSFDPTDRSVSVTEWPIAGAPVGVISTHLDVEWEYNAALISDATNFVPLTLHLHQTGVGSFCEAQIPGNPDWVGQDAVLQVVQHGPDGILYQCAAITFTAGGPADVPSGCTNSTGIAADWISGGSEPPASSTTEPPTETTPPPTSEPTDGPTTEPTEEPTTEPTIGPTSEPTAEPTTEPTSTGLSSEVGNDHTHTHPETSSTEVPTYPGGAVPTGTSSSESTTSHSPYLTTYPPRPELSNSASKLSYPASVPSSSTETSKGNSSAPTSAPSSTTIPFEGSASSLDTSSAVLFLAGSLAAMLAWTL